LFLKLIMAGENRGAGTLNPDKEAEEDVDATNAAD
jgi:hypothetical protein